MIVGSIGIFAQTKYAPLGFSSFTLPQSTRSIGLAGAGTALSADASAINLNPARLSLIDEKVNFSLDTYTIPALATTNTSKYVSLKYVYNQSYNSFGIGINSYSLGDINQVSETGGTRTISLPNEYKISIADAMLITDNSSIGISFDYINKTQLLYSSIPGTSSLMGAIGYIQKHTLSESKDRELLTGVALENIGSKTRDGYFLPTTLSIGTTFMQGYNDHTGTKFPFLIGIELSKLLVPSLPIYDSVGNITKGRDPKNIAGISTILNSFLDDPYKKNLQKWRVQLYSEINLIPEFALRTGYSYENTIVGSRNFFTVGAGYTFIKDNDIYNIDLGYIIPAAPNGILYKNIFSLSIKYKMGAKW